MAKSLMERMRIDCKETSDSIVRLIRGKIREEGKDGIILGLSGGVDSATVLVLSVLAVGPGRVRALYLPDRDSETGFFKKCRKIAGNSGVHLEVINIEEEIKGDRDIYQSLSMRFTGFSALFNRLALFLINRIMSPLFLEDIPFILSLQQQTCEEKRGISRILSSTIHSIERSFNVRHLERRKILEKFAKRNNLLLLGAANRSELFAGWFVKGGVDDIPFGVLSGLYKNQVRQLASFLGVPGEIIKQPPSPDMLRGVGDEDIMGISYDKIDRVAYVFENNLDESLALEEGVSMGEIRHIMKLHRLSSWKRAGK